MRLANPLTTLYRHRDLVGQFTLRELEMRHKGSRLGHLWSIFKPLSMLVLYVFIFGEIFGGKFGVLEKESTFDYALGIFMGLSLFNILAEPMAAAPLMIVNQPNFVKKVVFPLEVIPFSSVAVSVYHALISIALLLAIAPFSNLHVNWLAAVLLPIYIFPLVLMSLGIAWGLAALGVFIRDINQLVPFLATAVMYASAVVYSASKVPHSIYVFLKYNPLLQVITEARATILWHLPPHYPAIAYAYVTSFVMLAVGYVLFFILRPFFAEVI